MTPPGFCRNVINRSLLILENGDINFFFRELAIVTYLLIDELSIESNVR